MLRYPSDSEYDFYISFFFSCHGNQLYRFYFSFWPVLREESFVYFLNNDYCYNVINPMIYHGPGVQKQHILPCPLLAILVALVTIFIFREFHEKHIFVHICSILNCGNTKFSGQIIFKYSLQVGYNSCICCYSSCHGNQLFSFFFIFGSFDIRKVCLFPY